MKLIQKALGIAIVFAVLSITICLKTSTSFSNEEQKLENSSNESIYELPASNAFYPPLGSNYKTPKMVSSIETARANKEVGITSNTEDTHPENSK